MNIEHFGKMNEKAKNTLDRGSLEKFSRYLRDRAEYHKNLSVLLNEIATAQDEQRRIEIDFNN